MRALHACAPRVHETAAVDVGSFDGRLSSLLLPVRAFARRRSSRFVHWKIAIGAMLVFVVGLLPIHVVVSFMADWRRQWSVWSRGGIALVCWAVYIYLFWRIGDAFPITSSKHGTGTVHRAPGRTGM